MNSSSTIHGTALVGASDRIGSSTFPAIDAATGNTLSLVCESGAEDVADACALAEAAFPVFSELAPTQRAHFLEVAAEQIGELGDTLILRAMAETALPRARIESERARTTTQLRFFATLLREGGWLDATIDRAEPNRQPLPRPDLRRCQVALGPAAVFGASNFPLAFSVAGGDTASALAAGCPVVFKGHPGHPGTGELVARAIRSAVQLCGLPEGVFSFLPGSSHALGAALVCDPRIQAVGFTGSRVGGLALTRLAASRAQPIPVFAEMSSVNPVFLFPNAAHSRGAELARAYVLSLTQGAGQFCTNPGLLIAVDDQALTQFLGAAKQALAQVPAQTMLTAHIAAHYHKGTQSIERNPNVERVGRGRDVEGPNGAQAVLCATTLENFWADSGLAEEVFGPSSLVIRANSTDDFAAFAQRIEGQLTATLLFDASDEQAVARLLPTLTRRVGRIVANGWPTGVEVARAMVHGGPYPATTDGKTTSVGALAIQRFLRPICFQNMPDTLLPAVLRDDNAYGVPRSIDGVHMPGHAVP